MSKPKFTPGPWELSFADEDCVDNRWWEIEGPNGEHVASCHTCGGNTRATELANARLIVRAPELLKAVETLVHEQCQMTCKDWDNKCTPTCWVNQYKQLIDEAKGEI